jgi:hypothetical protein
MRLIEGNQLGLAGSTNQLLASERRIANEGLKGGFDAAPEIDDVSSEIFCRTRLVEVSEDGARAIE